MPTWKQFAWCLFLMMSGISTLVGCESESGSSPESTAAPSGPLTFQCDSGTEIQMERPTDSTVVLTYDDETLRLSRARSASASRYTGEDREWWVKGSGEGARGTLFRTGLSDDLPEAIADCVQK